MLDPEGTKRTDSDRVQEIRKRSPDDSRLVHDLEEVAMSDRVLVIEKRPSRQPAQNFFSD